MPADQQNQRKDGLGPPRQSRRSQKSRESLDGDNVLNFQYHSYADQRHRSGGNYRRSNKHKRSEAFNKQNYVQAMCQFFVRDDYDAMPHTGDPDIPLSWDKVEQVMIAANEGQSCPICLMPPTAAKITKCGHVYCFACIVHYLMISDKNWAKCPLCNDSIYLTDIRSCCFCFHGKISVGHETSFTLIARHKMSTLIIPWCIGMDEMRDTFAYAADALYPQYHKIYLMSASDIKEYILDRERGELETQFEVAKADGSVHEIPFIQQALDAVDQRQKTIAETALSERLASGLRLQGSPHTSPSLRPANALTANGQSLTQQDLKEMEIQLSEFGGALDEGTRLFKRSKSGSKSDGDAKSPTQGAVPAPTKPEGDEPDIVFFFQAVDGQYAYLHPINIKCLVHEYGSLSQCPQVITGKVLEVELMTMTSDLRKKYKFLSHVPLASELEVCEVDLRSYISKETYLQFKEEILRRKQARQKKQKREKRFDKQSRQVVDQQHREQYGAPRVNVPSALSEVGNVKLDAADDTLFPSMSKTAESEPKVIPLLASNLSESSSPTSFPSLPSKGSSFAEAIRKEGNGTPSPSWKRPTSRGWAKPVSASTGSGTAEDDEFYPTQNADGQSPSQRLDWGKVTPKKTKKGTLLFSTSGGRGGYG
eukprot:Clim_evm48s152 gene=Clim_evmTU48s152